MATTNTFASAATETKQSFWESFKARFEARKARMSKYVDGVKKVFSILNIVSNYLARVFERILNFAVKVSIIMIALILVQFFAKANPVEWNNCITNVVGAFDFVKNFVIEAFNGIFFMFR